ncbi:FUR family protein, Fe3+, Fe2+/Zn2+ uptake regulation [Hyperthermus butylicus DSM 5456]|uniref:FUR family protein, Fe3+, Fe2+/Zn2+ uptake regulation n=1 Tax=Hyperthermus butylicus (strain DSM 5456 / JCM 9403 / PLM1-5) TaxID=415426 RepID=A2BJ30_HYPBU|nr:FUR family protein, Fe3+, Fe2+/Zn2+ uptake regulation [Hyperthermus butylicus DSM 5456]
MEILERARREIPNISPSTVYNNLQLLEKLGFIKSFSIHGGTRYDNVHTHVNVVCIDTGKVFDLDDVGAAEGLARVLESKLPGARVENIVVYARCS